MSGKVCGDVVGLNERGREPTVAHLQVLLVSHPRRDMRDTGAYPPLMKAQGMTGKLKPRALRHLAAEHLGLEIQVGARPACPPKLWAGAACPRRPPRGPWPARGVAATAIIPAHLSTSRGPAARALPLRVAADAPTRAAADWGALSRGRCARSSLPVPETSEGGPALFAGSSFI